NQCEIQYKTSRNQRLQVEIALLKMCHIAVAIQLSKMPLPTEQPQEIKKKTSNTKPLVSPETHKVTEVPKEKAPISSKPKLVLPKFGDIAINAQIPNLDSVFEEKVIDYKKDPEYIQGNTEELFQEQDFLLYWKDYAE